MKKISELSSSPEYYEVDILDRIPKEVLETSQMDSFERQFVNGLVRIFKPHRLLEIGVHSGGGTSILLNAINDLPESTLTSVDILTDVIYGGKKKPVGFAVDMLYPLKNSQWHLHTGKDFSEICEGFKDKFDFCIIDSAHLHPVESLNFLCALPYLSEGAIVVFHDISCFKFYPLDVSPRSSLFASILCYGSIVGEKITPVVESYLAQNSESDQYGFANIGAVQVTESTKMYIRNVFDMLLFPWSGYNSLVGSYIEPVTKIIKKHYSPQLFKLFCESIKINEQMVNNDYKYAKKDSQINSIYDLLLSSKSIIFYGAGAFGKRMLELFKRNGLPKPIEIWDLEADTIVSIDNTPVVKPNFYENSANYCDTIFILTVQDKLVIDDITMKLLRTISPSKIFTYYEAEKSICHVESSKLETIF